MNMHPISFVEATMNVTNTRTNDSPPKSIPLLIADCLAAMAENDRCAKEEKGGRAKAAEASKRKTDETFLAWDKSLDALLAATPRSRFEVGLVASHVLATCEWGGEEVIPYDGWLALLQMFERYGAQRQYDANSRPDPVLALIDRHREQQAAVEAGQSDEEADALSEIANRTWWMLLDATPTTRSGATAWANYIVDLEARGVCPTIRSRSNGEETNVTLVALQRLASLMENETGVLDAAVQLQPDDPVLKISDQIVKLEARFNELDSHRPPAGPAKIYHDTEEEQITDRIYILRDGLTVAQATSLAGAAAQLAQISAICDSLNETVHDEKRANEEYRKVERMLFSIARVLQNHIPPVCVGSVLEMGKHRDPWRTYQDNLELAGIQA